MLEGTKRWIAGQRLYTDVVEVNPPLIFLENVLLTAGQLSGPAYFAGVCTVIAVSAIWVRKQGGNGLAALGAMMIGGLTDFGQRDHLALIFLMPFLSTSASRPLTGAWAFFGVALKPYFVIIPASFVIARCAMERSFRPIRAPQNLVLAGAGLTYLIAALVVWPQYFREIIPTAQFVYAAYGTEPVITFFLIAALIAIMLLIVSLTQKSLVPIAAAAGGALVVFFAQGRFWSYQFVPAASLAIYVVWLDIAIERGAIRFPLLLMLLGLVGTKLKQGPAEYQFNPIPTGARAVAFLSDNVTPAYPHTFECGVTNTTRYSALWIIPGAWNAWHDPSSPAAVKARGKALFSRDVATIQSDLRRGNPQLIYSDRASGKSYFTYPFDYAALVPTNYRRVGSVKGLDVWLRVDVPASILSAPPCGRR